MFKLELLNSTFNSIKMAINVFLEIKKHLLHETILSQLNALFGIYLTESITLINYITLVLPPLL